MITRTHDIEQQNTLLSNGPICIGEYHNQSNTRIELFKLMNQGNVKKLFLEIPACSPSVQTFLADPDTKLDGSEPEEVKLYISNMTLQTSGGDNRKIPWTSIIVYAKDRGVSVYCDDLPIVNKCYIKNNKLNYAYIECENFDVDPSNYFNKILLEQKTPLSNMSMSRVRNRLADARSQTIGVKVRNKYSAAIIRKYTDDLSEDNMRGVVIFGGSDHFNDKYKQLSLQELCHITNECVFTNNKVTPINSPKNDRMISPKRLSIFNETQESETALHIFLRSLAKINNLSSQSISCRLLCFFTKHSTETLITMLSSVNRDGLTPLELAKTIECLHPFIDLLETKFNDIKTVPNDWNEVRSFGSANSGKGSNL